MNTQLKIALSIVSVIFLIGFFGFVMPSLIGFLIAALLVICVSDIFSRRYRQAARTFNSATLAVCHQQGAIGKVATAFARSGPLRGPCYEYARRLMTGEDPVESAIRSRVPLQLTTAVAMRTSRSPESARQDQPSRFDQAISSEVYDSSVMPAYAQVMYLAVTAMVTCAVLSFMGIFIVPTIEMMMEEFGLAMPNSWLIVGSTPTRIMLVVVIGFLLLMTMMISWGSFFGIPLPRWLPIAPRVVEDKSDTLRGLANAIDTGMTVDQALELGALISLGHSQRKSLGYANHLIRQGASPAEALYRSGWLNGKEHDWLKGTTATRGAELLRSIADQRVRDAHANMRWLLGIAFPLIILLLGLAVLSYCYGFFGTLAKLVSGLG